VNTVSIVIPCYNAAPFLRETLDSALGQTHPPLEVIVVDDGSTDDSAAIAESYGPPVRVIRQKNQGESVARNRGLSEVKGSHVMFLDADDLLVQGAVERLMQAAQGDRETVVVMGCGHFTEDPQNPYATRMPQFNSMLPSVLAGCFGPTHSWLYPRVLVASLGGFDTHLQRGEDWEFSTRLALRNPPLRQLEYLGALHRRHRRSQTQRAAASEKVGGANFIVRRYCDTVFANDDLITICASTIFWTILRQIQRSRKVGITWPELDDLGRRLSELARMKSLDVSRCTSAWLVRNAGYRIACRIAPRQSSCLG